MKMNFDCRLMDMHTHILPGIDDGARSMDDALEMVRIAAEEGVLDIIATPHCGRSNPSFEIDKAKAVLIDLHHKVKELYPDMNIYLGNELYYGSGIIDELKAGRAATIGGTSYVLVEFSVKAEFDTILNAVTSFVREGYRPILAHIERYECLFRDMDSVYELIEHGAYVQVNARSFLAGRLNKRTSWCRQLLKEGLIHFVASDCHSSEHRPPVMAQALAKMVKYAGRDAVERIVKTNVSKLVRNEFI